jgi:tetratricopeptide (TPR) repeat protein
MNANFVSVQELKMFGKGEKAYDHGVRLLLKGDAAGSLAYFDRAIAENPANYKAYYNLGIAHFRLRRTADAEKAFQKSIDLTGGSYAPPQFAIGVILCQQQQCGQAEALIQRGLDVEPGSALGKFFLGWVQFALNRLVDAEKSAQQALLRKANFADAHLLLASIHLSQHNSPAVVADLQDYLKLDPRSPKSEQARSLLETMQHHTDQATDAAALATLKLMGPASR